MSSSNAVRVAAIKETTYGETPVAGNFFTARFVNESLSGTPETTESQQIRTDRMSSGQVVTGLTVGGELGVELAKETALENFMSSAMCKDWVTPAAVTTDLDFDATAKTLTRPSGSFITDLVKKGQFIKLGGMDDDENNDVVMVVDVTALILTVVAPATMITGGGDAASTFKICDYLEIGTQKISFSMEKAFTDITEKAINYRGMIANAMNISVSYGELISGSFNFSGNDHEPVSAAADFMTDGRTITAAATSNTLNGSIDMPFLASSSTGTLGGDDLCIQSIEMSLSNNLTDLTCIGKAAPEGYSLGTAQIEMNLSTYLKDAAWGLLEKKNTQEPFELGFAVKNQAGGYGFFIPALQVSFDDPSAGGQNQEVSLDMTGMAKVGDLGESALSIYRF